MIIFSIRVCRRFAFFASLHRFEFYTLAHFSFSFSFQRSLLLLLGSSMDLSSNSRFRHACVMRFPRCLFFPSFNRYFSSVWLKRRAAAANFGIGGEKRASSLLSRLRYTLHEKDFLTISSRLARFSLVLLLCSCCSVVSVFSCCNHWFFRLKRCSFLTI